MMRGTTARGWAAVLVLSVVLAAAALACGGDDEGDEADTVATVTTQTGTPAAGAATQVAATQAASAPAVTASAAAEARATVRLTGAANVSGTFPARCAYYAPGAQTGMVFEVRFQGWTLQVSNDRQRTEGRQQITRDSLGLPTGTAVILNGPDGAYGLTSDTGPITDEVTVGSGFKTAQVKADRKKLGGPETVRVEADFNCG